MCRDVPPIALGVCPPNPNLTHLLLTKFYFSPPPFLPSGHPILVLWPLRPCALCPVSSLLSPRPPAQNSGPSSISPSWAPSRGRPPQDPQGGPAAVCLPVRDGPAGSGEGGLQRGPEPSLEESISPFSWGLLLFPLFLFLAGLLAASISSPNKPAWFSLLVKTPTKRGP